MVDGMKRLKVTMLGVSGAGKTTFFSGVYHSMVSGTMIAKDKTTTVSLIGVEDDGTVQGNTGVNVANMMDGYKIHNVMNDFGTSDTQDFNFNIEITDKELNSSKFPLYIFDYPGGLVGDTDADEDETAILMEKVKDSDVILIMIDAIKLATNSNNMYVCKEKLGADRINVIMKNMIANIEANGVTVLTILTKTDSDKIPQELKENNFNKLCSMATEVLDGMFACAEMMVKKKNWSFALLPVTAVGEGNAVTKYNQLIDEYVCELKEGVNPKQKNIDLAIAYVIYKALLKRIKEYNAEMLGFDEKISNGKKWGLDSKARKSEAEYAKKQFNNRKQWSESCQKSVEALINGFGERFGEEVWALDMEVKNEL